MPERAAVGSSARNASRSSASSLRVGIAQVRRLLQTLQRDHFQLAIGPRVHQPRRQRLLLEHQQHGVDRRSRLKRRPAGEHLVENRAQAIDVAGRSELTATAGGLLRGHVARRAENRAGERQIRVGLDPLGQAEIGHVRPAVVVDQDVRRLQIAVQHACAMGKVDRLGTRAPAAPPLRAAASAPRPTAGPAWCPSTYFIVKYGWPSCSPTS